MSLTRRNLILTGAAALAARSARTADETTGGLITLSPRPVDLEMPVGGFVDEITPTEHFFVRCHTYTPEVKLSEWKLQIDGQVERPMSLTMADLRKFPRVELTGVLECAGNGRSFYEPHLPGAQWRFGSVGDCL